MAATPPILEVRDLVVDYLAGKDDVRAVNGVSLELAHGEFLGLVGESGCGKSTLCYAIARLLGDNAEIVSGDVLFSGQNLVHLREKQLRHLRWRQYSVVMQSAMNALNPVMTVGAQLTDAMQAHTRISKREARKRGEAVLQLVGIDPVHLGSYPHQLSGGMRQRAMIAMALVFIPDLIIMDEPTSALDVVAQRSLMVQVKELQRDLGFAVIFVTHDISLVARFSDRLAIMYAGEIVELGATRQVFTDPKHPYSRGLLGAFPSIHGPKEQLKGIPGSPPDLRFPPSGCRFHPRCPAVMKICPTAEPPEYSPRGNDLVRCYLYANQEAEDTQLRTVP
ncbi:MAG TPA: ABC transporter ATP-binding protein [Chloroflexota bacterium]